MEGSPADAMLGEESGRGAGGMWLLWKAMVLIWGSDNFCCCCPTRE